MVHSCFRTSTVKNKSAILTLSCFGIILISMFLPFYEALRPVNLIPADSFIVVKTTEFSTTLSVFEFNGFGSLFALINLPVSLLLVLSHFFFPVSRITAILSVSIFVLSMALLVYGNELSANGPYEDSMLKGFYLMLICEVALITQSLTKIVNAPPKEKRSDSNTDLLDL
ncbi:hypothetical protein D3C71_445210 [compost metagenome]